MPILSPFEDDLFQQEIKRFNELYREGLEEAIERFENRAPYYDVDRPIWLRVLFPEGLINEVVDKAARLQNAYENMMRDNISEEQMWEKILDEIPDIINYSNFIRSIIIIFREQAYKMTVVDKE